MKGLCVVTLLNLLLATASLAQEGIVSVVDGDTLTIYMPTGELGDQIDPARINWPESIDEYIAMVNSGQGEFFVEVSSDSVRWVWIKEILRKNPAAAKVKFDRVESTNNAAATAARFTRAIELLVGKGLERKAVRYIPGDDVRVCIKIYPDIPPTQDEEPATMQIFFITVEPDTTIEVVVYVDDDDEFSLGAGVEWVAVANGKPITVPAFTAEYRKRCWLFAGTLGWGNFGDNQFGSQYQKLYAASITWLPSGDGFGLMGKILYASQGVDSVGEYLQQGYGPYLGLAYRGEHLSAHLAGGVQYFDRYQSNRHSELSATAGCRYNINF